MLRFLTQNIQRILIIFPLALVQASVSYAQDSPKFRILSEPIVETEREILFVLADSGHRPATIHDIIEKDPFNRGVDFDVYKYTSVRCNYNMQFINSTGVDVAIRDPFTTVFTLTLVRENGDRVQLQGNVGMSAIMLEENIFRKEYGFYVEFTSLTSHNFPSREEAEAKVSDGSCNYNDIVKIDSNTMGEIMFSDETEWRQIGSHLMFILRL